MTAAARKYIIFILICISGAPLFAELSISITPIELGEGMAQLESMINMETADAAEGIVKQTEPYVTKPLLYGSMASAQTLTASLIPLSLPKAETAALHTGTSASAAAPTFNTQELSAQLEAFTPEGDIALGAAGALFSAYAAFPADFILEGLDFTAGAGLMRVNYEGVTLSSSTLHASAAFTFFAPEGNEPVSWSGLRLQTGATYSGNSIGMVYKLGDITQTFPIDPDGAGPLLPFSLTIGLSPELNIEYRSNILAVPIAASTGLSLLDIFSLNAGIGTVLAAGGNSIAVSSDEEIRIQGYLSGLVENTPRLVISGEIPGAFVPIISPFIFGSFYFTAGGVVIGIPLSWDFGNTLTAAISIGGTF